MTESDNDESPKTLKNVERVDFESMLNISKHDPYESSSPRKKQSELQINCVDYPVIKEKRDIFQTPRTSRPQQN